MATSFTENPFAGGTTMTAMTSDRVATTEDFLMKGDDGTADGVTSGRELLPGEFGIRVRVSESRAR